MTHQRKKILVIDDNPDTLRLVQDILGDTSFDCITAESPVEGMEKALFYKPQMILLDLMLPEMSGFGFIRELKNREELKEVPVVIYSSMGDQEVVFEMMSLGAAGYIRKSCSSRELITMIQEYAQ